MNLHLNQQIPFFTGFFLPHKFYLIFMRVALRERSRGGETKWCLKKMNGKIGKKTTKKRKTGKLPTALCSVQGRQAEKPKNKEKRTPEPAQHVRKLDFLFNTFL
jgi:hypothetical protein